MVVVEELPCAKALELVLSDFLFGELD